MGEAARHRLHLHKIPAKPLSQAELQLEKSKQVASVVIIGSEEQMYRMLLKFGPIDLTERQNVQQLLAIPCQLCHPNEILPATIGALHNGLHELASRLRPDIDCTVRALHLKKAIQSLGADFLRFPDLFCLASITLPYSLQDINAIGMEAGRRLRRDVYNQIDLQVTAFARCRAGEASPAETAARALRDTCGISIEESIWDEACQLRLRKKLGVDFPIKCSTGNDSWMLAVVLPSDARAETRDGHLCFSEAVPLTDEGLQVLVHGPPNLPRDWSFVQSVTTGEIFFVHEVTREKQSEPPQHELPEGWLRTVSVTTGQLYFFHAEKNLSTFEPPRM